MQSKDVSCRGWRKNFLRIIKNPIIRGLLILILINEVMYEFYGNATIMDILFETFISMNFTEWVNALRPILPEFVVFLITISIVVFVMFVIMLLVTNAIYLIKYIMNLIQKNPNN